jgi:serine/threonine protein kinase, bacterial
MPSIYCSQGHENVPGSRFCSFCGETLVSRQGIAAGMILASRYRIQRELGHGGFGRSYLAEDINRFNEFCVLKEFAPQVQGTFALQKAEELFGREAGVLYQLRHPQIPRFRELFRADLNSQGRLFLVQDYIEGKTYRQILETRRSQSMAFSEAEVLQLMSQLLPVLHYIHSVGVIHRDISPDNLILRYADQMPVLIDFGGVKQAAAAASVYVQPGEAIASPPTRLGKVGYAPNEQMQEGRVSPHSDLYALAMTVLVLLTGREPQEILNSPSGLWKGLVSSAFAGVLDRMLAPNPNERFPSAAIVLQTLAAQFPSQFATVPLPQPDPYAAFPISPAYGHAAYPSAAGDDLSQMKTHAIAQRWNPPAATPALQSFEQNPMLSPDSAPARRRVGGKGVGLGCLMTVWVLIIAGGIAWRMRDRWLPQFAQPDQPEEIENQEETSNPPTEPEPPPFSPEEQARKAALGQRRQSLGVPSAFLTAITNETFYERYPNQKGRTLTTKPEDEEWRSQWDKIASQWLDTLEQHVNADARKRLGSYSSNDLTQWRQAINQIYVGSRTLNDLTDVRFFKIFPNLRGQENWLNQPIGQIWYAIAFQQVRDLQSGETLGRIEFSPGASDYTVRDRLAPGTGKVYIARLAENQPMRVDVDAPGDRTRFSIYLPNPNQTNAALLEDSSELSWSGDLPQSGYYEFVIVCTGDEAIDYQFKLSVEAIAAPNSVPNSVPNPTVPTPRVE